MVFLVAAGANKSEKPVPVLSEAVRGEVSQSKNILFDDVRRYGYTYGDVYGKFRVHRLKAKADEMMQDANRDRRPFHLTRQNY